ncbi:hypothetical protein [Cribrihabitans neustonicus]
MRSVSAAANMRCPRRRGAVTEAIDNWIAKACPTPAETTGAE